MGAEKAASQVFDLRRIEDIFACLETISLARSALFSTHPELAGQLARVSDGLGALAQLLMEEGPAGLIAEAEAPPMGWESRANRLKDKLPAAGALAELSDHLQDAPYHRQAVSAAKTNPSAGEAGVKPGIVDILTGEKIK